MSNTRMSQIPAKQDQGIPLGELPPNYIGQPQGLPQYLPQQQGWTPSSFPQNSVPQNWVPASSQIQGVQNFSQNTNITTTQQGVIKGESRIEYIPYTKEVTEYITQEVVEYIPREKKITDYYAIEYVTEHVPQVIQEKYIEYVPVETIKERTEYQAVTKQSYIQNPEGYQQSVSYQQSVQYQPQYTQSTYVPQIAQPQQIQYQPQQTQFQTQVTTVPYTQSPPIGGSTNWQPVYPGTTGNVPRGVVGQSGFPQTQGFQPSGISQGFQPSGIPQGFQPSGIPQGFQPSGIPQGFQPSGIPQGFQPSGQPQGLPQGFQPQGVQISPGTRASQYK